MEFLTLDQAVFRDRGDGTTTHYFLFPEYDFSPGEIGSGCVQEWHHHDQIEELIYLVEGTLEVRWAEHSRLMKQTISAGTVVRVGTDSHTLANTSSKTAKIIGLKLVLNGKNQRELLKMDRITDEPPEK